MTIEKLLEMSADQLEAMSDKELEEHFAKYLPTTRPEFATAAHEKKHSAEQYKLFKNVPTSPEILKRKLVAAEIAKKLGLKIKL